MELVLGRDSDFLRLQDTDGRESLRRSSDGALDYVYATLQLSALSAMARVSLVAGVDLPLSSFFEELAAHWRGSKGTRTWAAYEGGLELSCTHDGLGYVALEVALQQGSGTGWLVRGEGAARGWAARGGGACHPSLRGRSLGGSTTLVRMRGALVTRAAAPRSCCLIRRA